MRGPQGTLYGALSLGGTVRVIPRQPDVSSFSGNLEVEVSQTENASELNKSLHGVLNVPIVADRLAVRLVAYGQDNEGYIDNVAGSNPTPNIVGTVAMGRVAKDVDGIGTTDTNGFRLSALWQPVDDISLSLNYVNQEDEQIGWPEVDLGLPGPYQQARVLVGEGDEVESLRNNIEIYNFVADLDFGSASLTSTTSNIEHSATSEFDLSFLIGPTFGPTVSSNIQDYDVWVQELRLVSELGGAFEYIVGAYFEDKERYRYGVGAWGAGCLRLIPRITLCLAMRLIANSKPQFLVKCRTNFQII